jgi:hypothetical protein
MLKASSGSADSLRCFQEQRPTSGDVVAAGNALTAYLDAVAQPRHFFFGAYIAFGSDYRNCGYCAFSGLFTQVRR